MDTVVSDMDEVRDQLLEVHAIDAAPSEALAECLVMGLKKDALVDLCKALGLRRYANKNKNGLAAMLNPYSSVVTGITFVE